MTGTVACVVRGSGTRGAALSPLARVTAPHPGRVLPGVTPSGPRKACPSVPPLPLVLRKPRFREDGYFALCFNTAACDRGKAPATRGAWRRRPSPPRWAPAPRRHSRFLLPAPERSLAAEAWARLSHSKAVSVFVVFVIVLQAAVGAFCSTLKKKKKRVRNVGSLDRFSCHFLQDSKFCSPNISRFCWFLLQTRRPAAWSPWSATGLLAGRVMPSYHPRTHRCAEDPLLLNDLLLLAEFLWLQILFLSHSVQLNWSPSVTVATSRWGSLTRVSGEAASV